MCNSKTCRVIVKHVMCNLQKRMRSFKNINMCMCMCHFDHKHVYVSLLKRKCLKVKHVSVSCFTVYASVSCPFHSRTLRQCVLSVPQPNTTPMCSVRSTAEHYANVFCPFHSRTLSQCVLSVPQPNATPVCSVRSATEHYVSVSCPLHSRTLRQ